MIRYSVAALARGFTILEFNLGALDFQPGAATLLATKMVFSIDRTVAEPQTVPTAFNCATPVRPVSGSLSADAEISGQVRRVFWAS